MNTIAGNGKNAPKFYFREKIEFQKSFKSLLALILVFFVGFSSLVSIEASEKKLTWRDLIYEMEDLLNESYKIYDEQGDADKAIEKINEAYFGYYEKRGIEKTVMSRISGKRGTAVEYQFSTTKKNIRKGLDKETIRENLDKLITMLLEDAYTLDGLVYDPATHTRDGVENLPSAEETQSTEGENLESEQKLEQDFFHTDAWISFYNSFLIIFREGLEAILIVAAIIAYLVKSGHKDKLKHIYLGVLLALLLSVVMAIALNVISSFLSQNVVGAGQEIFEGVTMLIAVVVLFQVSNWLLGKAEAEKWDAYLKEKVDSSVGKNNMFSLIFVSFLAVFREGAETILFYQALSVSPGNDMNMMILGGVVGTIVLAIVYVIIRFYSIKLPIRQFFIATSVLLYIMAISFVGSAIFEFQEADLIGTTLIEGLPTIQVLGIYPMVENLTGQAIMLLFTLASVIYLTKIKKIK